MCCCCGNCDACSVVCVAYVCAVRVWGWEDDSSAGVGSG